MWYSVLLSFYLLILVPYFVQLSKELCTGTEIIDTPEECKVATSLLDLTFRDQPLNASIYPKGCFRYIETKKVFWNTHSSGRQNITEHSDSYPICKKGG